MLCDVCYRMLRGQERRQWRGTFDLQFLHHLSLADLEKSARIGCMICRTLIDEFQISTALSIYGAVAGVVSRLRFLLPHTPRPSQAVFNSAVAPAQTFVTRASISYVPDFQGLFRLEFTRKTSNWNKIFALKQLDLSTPSLHVPISGNTALDEIVHLARKWIRRCEESHVACNADSDTIWHPTRLLDIEPEHLTCIGPRRPRDVQNNTPICLVNTNDWTRKQRYVTLSHCWGQAQILCLRGENEQRFFDEGIRFEEFPLTFRDAVLFASRLGIRYIWIDSLCIKQGDAKDWLNESSKMHKVYSHSFCNLSATAAKDSSHGLFFNRRVSPLWEYEVNLCTDGIPEVNLYRKNIADASKIKPVQPCAIIDPLFWDHGVDSAILNTRGWVLQERLMAPRVLHFCKDQIAWECQEEDAAECYPDGLQGLRLSETTRGQVVSRERLKGLDPLIDGKALRSKRFKNEPLPGLIPDLYSFELWKRIVEVYSKARLTNPDDKLVALSGIANLMAKKIGSQYVAGMWEKHLDSQLLWHVEPHFANGRFSYLSSRPPKYRAPSFSWASVDSQTGITYGDVTNEGLLITILDCQVTPVTDIFGLLSGGYLIVAGGLRRIAIAKSTINQSTRYSWNVADDDGYTESFTNVYMDDGSNDAGFLEPGSQTYCMPAAKQTNEEYLICILLQRVTGEDLPLDSFRRIGLSKVALRSRHQQDNWEYSNLIMNSPHHAIRII